MFEDDIFEGWLSVPGMEMLQPDHSNVNESYVTPPSEPQQFGQHTLSESQTSLRSTSPQLQLALSPKGQPSPPGEPAPRRRKGHTKSRLGCLGCKRRKIKCLEQWPSCSSCLKRGLPCVYPTVFKFSQQERLVSEVLKSPQKLLEPTHGTPVYSANDMRLFHHYLMEAHPMIPVTYDGLWTRDIPAYSHQYKYLMHGILALSASHLALITDGKDNASGLFHRQRAITGLEEAFRRWPPTAEEAHVMLATSYLLTFQSAYISDGLFDHFMSLRGCAFVSQLISRHQLKGAFSVPLDLTAMSVQVKLTDFPTFDQKLARATLRALAALQPRMESPQVHGIHRAFYAQLVGSVRPLVAYDKDQEPEKMTNQQFAHFEALQAGLLPGLGLTDDRSDEADDSVDFYPHMQFTNPMLPGELAVSYEEIMAGGAEGIYNVPPDHKVEPARSFNCLLSTLLILATWPQDEVLYLFASTNKLGRILTAYFCCIRFLIAPLSAPESAMKTPISAVVKWCEDIIELIDDEEEVKWTEYLDFPRKVLKTMRACVDKKKALTFYDVYIALANDPDAFREGRAPKISLQT